MPAPFCTRYCTIAPVSALPGAVIPGLLVMPSVLKPVVPFVLSLVNAALVTATVVSNVKAMVWLSLTLPALSVWRI